MKNLPPLKLDVKTIQYSARDDLLSCTTCWVVQVPKKVNGARVADFEGIFHHMPIHQSPTSQESNSRISIKYKLFQFYEAMFHLFSGAPVPRKFPILWDHLWQEMGNYGKKKNCWNWASAFYKTWSCSKCKIFGGKIVQINRKVIPKKCFFAEFYGPRDPCAP